LACNHCQGRICAPWTFQVTDTLEVMKIIRFFKFSYLTLRSSCPQQGCECSVVASYLSKFPSTLSYATRLTKAISQGHLPTTGCGKKNNNNGKKNSLEQDVEEYLFE
jgi:hypothetical protein